MSTHPNYEWDVTLPPPDELTPDESERVETKTRESHWGQTVMWIVLLLAVVFLYTGLFLGLFPQYRNDQAGETNFVDGTKLDALEATVTALQGGVLALSPTVEGVGSGDGEQDMWNWQINGRLQKRNSNDIFSDVLTIIKVKGQTDGDWELVDILPGGDFHIQYVHQREPLNVRVTFANMPAGWQTELNASSTGWRQVEGASHTFEALFNEPQNVSLVADTYVERTFTGVVTLGTNSEPIADFPPAPRPNVLVHLEAQGDDEQWRHVGEGVTGEDGRFVITHKSTTDNPVYRLYADIDPIYETALHSQSDGHSDVDKWVITHSKLANEVDLVYVVTAVALPIEHAQLVGPDWVPNVAADSQQFFITALTDETRATWSDIYLPPGNYKMEVWTPMEQAVTAQIRYTVDIENGISEGDPNCTSAYISIQADRKNDANGYWWDFASGNQTTLLVQSNGGSIVVTVLPNANAGIQTGVMLGLGPVRFIVVQGEPERAIEPCQ